MPNKLFSSKTRVDILKLFLFNTNDSFYQRQISSLAAQSIRGVQREVDKLNRIGIIERPIQGNRIYYKLNKKCPIAQDLKNIFFKSVGIAEVLKENFKEKKIKLAFIYGYYAKGEENLLSDIDLMVIGDISSKDLSGILSKPKKDLMREINYAVFSLREFISKTVQRDHFINSILKDKKIYIIGNKDELKGLIKSGKAKAT